MKNTISFFFTIAMVAVFVLFFTACAEEQENITITVTGAARDFSSYTGWDAVLGLGSGSEVVAIGLPLTIRENTTSLAFAMLTPQAEPFNKAENYTIVFWFQKSGERDSDYFGYNQNISRGANKVDFASFSRL